MRSWRIACVCIVALGVTGCSVAEFVEGLTRPKAEPRTVEKVDPAAEEMARREAALERERAAARERQAALAALRTSVPRPGTKPEIIQPERLVGLDSAGARSMFGPPHFVSNETPATVWYYRGVNCVMRLYFYPDLSTNTLRTLTYEFTALNSEEASQDAEICASGLRWAHAATTR